MKKRLLSLFSGCGGMDLGFEGNFETMSNYINTDVNSDWIKKRKGNKVLLNETPFETVFSNDILKPAEASWIPFFASRGTNSKVFHSESIVDLVKLHREGKFNFPDNIDIVTGGFPCQDFSVAGNRKGFNSDKGHNGGSACELEIASAENRGQLYMWLKEVVEITKPKVFYAENVKGLITLGDVKNIIENDFRSIDNGYIVVPSKVLNAANYGVPQSRERIIFIGLNKRYLKKEVINILESGNVPDDLNLYPEETHYNSKKIKENNKSILKPYSTCKMAFEKLLEPDEENNDLSQKGYSKAKFYKGYQGNIEVKLDHISPTIRAEHHGNIEYRRLSVENGGKYIKELEKFNERRLTVRECARLQTFPDNYEFVRKVKKGEPYNLSASGAYKVIGNAVPPLLAYHLAKKLEKNWDNLFIS